MVFMNGLPRRTVENTGTDNAVRQKFENHINRIKLMKNT